MVAQAPIHALAVVLFVSRVGQFMSALGKAALAGFAGVIIAVPYGFENALWGFQSQFYFMMLFGIATIWLCWRYDPFTPRWWLGVCAAFASLFTTAGGVFAILAVLAFLALRLVLERRAQFKREAAGIAILTAIALFGILTTPHPPSNEEFVATSFKAFFFALTGVLSWPCEAHWACIIVQAPLVILALTSLFRRVPFSDGRWFPVIIGAFLWIQAILTAYRRCNAWARTATATRGACS